MRGALMDVHPGFVLLGAVRHACPICDIGSPRTFCHVCQGVGTLSDEQLAMFELTFNNDPRTRTHNVTIVQHHPHADTIS
jgi:hypothetical protein